MAKKAIFGKLGPEEKLELLKKITARSNATEEDVEGISRKIKIGIAKRHGLSVK